MTDRQQFKQWISESSLIDNSEETLTKIFAIAINHKKTHPDWSLKSLYSYAYVTYVNKFLLKDLEK